MIGNILTLVAIFWLVFSVAISFWIARLLFKQDRLAAGVLVFLLGCSLGVSELLSLLDVF